MTKFCWCSSSSTASLLKADGQRVRTGWLTKYNRRDHCNRAEDRGLKLQ